MLGAIFCYLRSFQPYLFGGGMEVAHGGVFEGFWRV